MATEYTKQEPFGGWGHVPWGNPDSEDKEFRRGGWGGNVTKMLAVNEPSGTSFTNEESSVGTTYTQDNTD